jgi:hypothetical protein
MLRCAIDRDVISAFALEMGRRVADHVAEAARFYLDDVAPMSPRSMPQNGPARRLPSSRTLIPDNGRVTALSFLIAMGRHDTLVRYVRQGCTRARLMLQPMREFLSLDGRISRRG